MKIRSSKFLVFTQKVQFLYCFTYILYKYPQKLDFTNLYLKMTVNYLGITF